MKGLLTGLFLLLLVFSVPAHAQKDSSQITIPMMGRMQMHQGMMGEAMSCGMHGRTLSGMGDDLIMQLCHFGCPGFILRMEEELGLTDKQIMDMKNVMSDYQKYAITKKADINVVVIEISDMMERDKPDFSKVREKVDAIAAKEKELRSRFLDTIEKSRDLLSDEQVKKLQTLEPMKGRPNQGRSKMMRQMDN